MASGAIVIDNGSDTLKVGFADETSPRAILPAVVGHPRTTGILIGAKKTYYGAEAIARRGALTLRRPIERGLVVEWSDLEALWRYVFEAVLAVQPDQRAILVTNPPDNPRSDRERLVQLLFEVFSAPAVYVADTASLALAAYGRSTGLAVDVGDTFTSVTPVVDGAAITSAGRRLDLGGRDVDGALQALLRERGWSLTTTAEQALLRDLKETLGYVAADYQEAIVAADVDPAAIQATYPLPDGQVITVDTERFRCAELLFTPSRVGVGQDGVDTLAYDAVMGCDPAVRAALLDGVVLAGGSSRFPGLATRLERGLTARVAAGLTVGVSGRDDRGYASWIGGALRCAAPAFASRWITAAEYEREGPGIVHAKCV
ncbi:MAG: actin family protein [Nannocystaceae bacterium]